jgi:hypothetical protein
MLQDWASTTFPGPLLDYVSADDNSTIRTSVDGGQINQRQRFQYEMKTQTVKLFLSDLFFTMFQAWVFYKLHRGADTFLMLLPIEGSPATNQKVRMVNGVYQSTYTDPFWAVTFQLEIFEESST